MKIAFPDLPYGFDALEPAYSSKTLHLHYEKHHRTYFDKTVGLIRGAKLENAPIEEIVRHAAEAHAEALFNNAAQFWYHNRFWESMTPGGGGAPKGEIAKWIDRDLGGYEKFHEAFVKKAEGQFGSGWVWLVNDSGKLRIISTSNASTPLTTAVTALVAFDVWEHAYYLDYQNRRPDFAKAFLDKLVNWDNANRALRAASSAELEPAK